MNDLQDNILLKTFLLMAVVALSVFAARYITNDDEIEKRVRKIENKMVKIEKIEKVEKVEKIEDNTIDMNTLALTLNSYFAENGIENTLITIVSKMDEKNCYLCTPREKETIVSIKMMYALKMGDIKKAEDFLKTK